jgi:hypothetical protein
MDSAPSQQPQTQPPNTLDYGRRAPLLGRRGFRILRRFAIAAILITAIAFSAYQIRSNWPALHLYYLQHECLAHPIPPGVVVYSSDQPSAVYKSSQLEPLVNEAQAGLYPPYNSMQRVPVYFGIRQASNGTKRFIAVYVVLEVRPGAEPVVALFTINRPTTLAPPETLDQNFLVDSDDSGEQPEARPNVLIYSGVEDPYDKSRLTLRFDVCKTHLVVDCVVQPDGSIVLQQSLLPWPLEPDGSRRPSGPIP